MISDVTNTEKLNQISVKEEGVYPSSPPSFSRINPQKTDSIPKNDSFVDSGQQVKENGEKTTSEKPQSKTPKLEEQIDRLNAKLYRLNRQLLFKVDKKINRNYISVIDKKTKEVIKEFPPKEIRNLMATLNELEEIVNPSDGTNNILLNTKV